MKKSSSLWASCGALLTAILSSACCWLPLLLLAFGASAAGVGSFFEQYRPYLLGVTALLLSRAFYLVYFRKSSCEDGECSTPNSKLERFNKTILWVAAIAVLGFTLFPNYIGSFLGNSHEQAQPINKEGLTEFVVEIEGMTCEACAVHNQEILKKVSGIRFAKVSYEEKTATLLAEKIVTEETIQNAIEKAGYKATQIQSTQH